MGSTETKLLSAAGVDGSLGLDAVLDRSDWFADEPLAAALCEPLMRLAARYLFQEKRTAGSVGCSGGRGENIAGCGASLDRVAHFHLTNGARIERINWIADKAQKGLGQAARMMVNYRYVLRDIERRTRAAKRFRLARRSAPF